MYISLEEHTQTVLRLFTDIYQSVSKTSAVPNSSLLLKILSPSRCNSGLNFSLKVGSAFCERPSHSTLWVNPISSQQIWLLKGGSLISVEVKTLSM